MGGIMFWQKNGEGLKFRGHYHRDANGERIIVLTAINAKGKVVNKTAESWQMLKAAGWKRVP